MKLSSFTKTLEQNLEMDRQLGFSIIRSKIAPVTFSVRPRPEGRVQMMGYRGKGSKPTFNFSFKNAARAEEYAAEFARAEKIAIEKVAARKAEKVAARSALNAADYWAVGDIGKYSWGWEQTNPEFWQVVAVGAKSIKIREVNQERTSAGFQSMAGNATPIPNEFVKDGDILTKILSPGGTAPMRFGTLFKWDGRPTYWSSYA